MHAAVIGINKQIQLHQCMLKAEKNIISTDKNYEEAATADKNLQRYLLKEFRRLFRALRQYVYLSRRFAINSEG